MDEKKICIRALQYEYFTHICLKNTEMFQYHFFLSSHVPDTFTLYPECAPFLDSWRFLFATELRRRSVFAREVHYQTQLT